MKKFSSLFDDFSTLKNEYKNSLKEPISTIHHSNQELILPNQFSSFLQTPFHANKRDHYLENANFTVYRTPMERTTISPFPDLDTVFRERRQQAKREIQQFYTENLYSILNLDASASQKDITTSYRRLSLKYHPDKNGGNDEMFTKLNQAYKILSNPELRNIYDEHGLACVLSYMDTLM